MCAEIGRGVAEQLRWRLQIRQVNRRLAVNGERRGADREWLMVDGSEKRLTATGD